MRVRARNLSNVSSPPDPIDPLATLDRVMQMAIDWGSELVEVGALGHINPASGFGEWPLADQRLQSLES